MSTILKRVYPSSIPITFTIVLMVTTFIVSAIINQTIGLSPAYTYVIAALLTIGVAFSFRRPKEMRLTSKFKWSSLPYYLVPLLYILTFPLLQGGYNFTFLSSDTIIMMSGIGVFEEVLTHGICMALLLSKWGQHEKYQAAIISSLCFGLIHLNNIIPDPTNVHLIMNKLSTVIFATFIGIGFAGLAYKSNSIWLISIFHALIDITANVGSLEYFTQTYLNWGLRESFVSIVYTLPFGLYGLWLLKGTKKIIRTN